MRQDILSIRGVLSLTQRVLIIANPVAGRGLGSEYAHELEEKLQHSERWELLDMVMTWRRGETPREFEIIPDHQNLAPATTIARAMGDQVDRIVVIGGDGTLRETVEGLSDSARARVAIVFAAIGNANVIAREFGIRPIRSLHDEGLVFGEKIVRVDCGRVGERIFIAMIGIGFDALITEVVAACRRTRLGAFLYGFQWGANLLYALGVLKTLCRFRPIRVTISGDGEPQRGCFPTAWIQNTECYSKGWAVTPGANPTDGELDLHACRGADWLRVHWVMFAAMFKKHVPSWVSHYTRAKRLEIQAPACFAWQVDGDPMARTDRLVAEVVPGFFRLVVSEDWANPQPLTTRSPR